MYAGHWLNALPLSKRGWVLGRQLEHDFPLLPASAAGDQCGLLATGGAAWVRQERDARVSASIIVS